MEATEKNLFNNDIVVRLGAFALVTTLNACMSLYFAEFAPHLHGYFIAPLLNNCTVLWFSVVFIKTAFTQDVKEVVFFEVGFYVIVYLLYALGKKSLLYSTYIWLGDNRDIFFKFTYVLFVARMFWPCRNKDSGEYANWPVFGLIGLYQKLTKTRNEYAPASSKQAIWAYVAIAASICIAYLLNKFGIKNAVITQAVPTIFLFGFASIKSKEMLLKRIAEYRKKKAEAHRLQELARIAEAKAARLADECQGLQAAVTAAQKIISQQMDVFAQAQDEQAKERARIAILEAAIASGHGAATDAGLLREILNPANPHYSIRMVACVKMFEHFQGKVIEGKSPKDAIAKYAVDHAEELGLLYKGEPSQNAADQCAFVLNWVNEAGAPRTQARTK